jgi:hypothetical protein
MAELPHVELATAKPHNAGPHNRGNGAIQSRTSAYCAVWPSAAAPTTRCTVVSGWHVAYAGCALLIDEATRMVIVRQADVQPRQADARSTPYSGLTPRTGTASRRAAAAPPL